jgi:hypothetical protein
MSFRFFVYTAFLITYFSLPGIYVCTLPFFTVTSIVLHLRRCGSRPLRVIIRESQTMITMICTTRKWRQKNLTENASEKWYTVIDFGSRKTNTASAEYEEAWRKDDVNDTKMSRREWGLTSPSTTENQNLQGRRHKISLVITESSSSLCVSKYEDEKFSYLKSFASLLFSEWFDNKNHDQQHMWQISSFLHLSFDWLKLPLSLYNLNTYWSI